VAPAVGLEGLLETPCRPLQHERKVLMADLSNAFVALPELSPWIFQFRSPTRPLAPLQAKREVWADNLDSCRVRDGRGSVSWLAASAGSETLSGARAR
jgi:hypothetical protein